MRQEKKNGLLKDPRVCLLFSTEGTCCCVFYLLFRGNKGKAGWDSSLGLCLGLWQKPSLLALLCLLGQDDKKLASTARDALSRMTVDFRVHGLAPGDLFAILLCCLLCCFRVILHLFVITRKIFCTCFKKINLKSNQNTCQRKTRIDLQGFLDC